MNINKYNGYSLDLDKNNQNFGNSSLHGDKVDKFYQWFVGFSDGESNFSIVPSYGESGVSSSATKITKLNFRFTIGLHRDDKNALLSIHNLLAVGNINENGAECKFVVSDKEGIRKLISIFDKYNLNTTKYLDYLDFKEAFIPQQKWCVNRRIKRQDNKIKEW